MGGKKLRLSVVRKRHEKKHHNRIVSGLLLSIPVKHIVHLPPLTVSIPASIYFSGPVMDVDTLRNRIASFPLPVYWIVDTAAIPITLCKLNTYREKLPPRTSVFITVSIDGNMKWDVSFIQTKLNPKNCFLFKELPATISSVSCISTIVSLVDSCTVCEGNPDTDIIEVWRQRFLTLHGCNEKNISGYIDEISSPHNATIRHMNCCFLLKGGKGKRCPACVAYRSTLLVQLHRSHQALKNEGNHTAPSSHVNYRYQHLPQLVSRLSQLHQQGRIICKRMERMMQKIEEKAEAVGVTLDCDTHDDVLSMMKSSAGFFENLPEDSFRQLFWNQQLKAASKKNARCMKWHPLMIRWCLSLRHRSNSAYEMLRESGCIKLPTQRTLRDYTYYVQASTGFSSEVDQMLLKAADVKSGPERDKCVLLLIDEMHIREDLVFDKHSGKMIGYTNLGEINNHLIDFEQSISNPVAVPKFAKTMLVFMVRGLFNKLQFAYVQFPAIDLSGDLLYDPFWEAVGRIEKCGLKVLAATMDGASINRCLVKLHKKEKGIVYKSENPYASDNRDLLFFSDPPHLLKTIRNCWNSKYRCLWIKGKHILWSHLNRLYDRDMKSGMGLRMLPKLKFEHISLTSFSKMRVDLAAQVLSESVSKALELTGGEETSETAKFVGMVDRFFDALNVHNYTHGIHARKQFQMPYISVKDSRLKWIEEDFLSYLNEWEESVKERPGEFTKTQRNMMLLSPQTRLGLKVTCKSFVELVKYIFTMSDVKSFLSQRLCQDPLENFFGRQRQRGGVHDNPNVKQFTENTQALRVVKMIGLSKVKRGNCRGGAKEEEEISVKENSTPLPKRPRKLSKPLGLY